MLNFYRNNYLCSNLYTLKFFTEFQNSHALYITFTSHRCIRHLVCKNVSKHVLYISSDLSAWFPFESAYPRCPRWNSITQSNPLLTRRLGNAFLTPKRVGGRWKERKRKDHMTKMKQTRSRKSPLFIRKLSLSANRQHLQFKGGRKWPRQHVANRMRNSGPKYTTTDAVNLTSANLETWWVTGRILLWIQRVRILICDRYIRIIAEVDGDGLCKSEWKIVSNRGKICWVWRRSGFFSNYFLLEFLRVDDVLCHVFFFFVKLNLLYENNFFWRSCCHLTTKNVFVL